MKEKERDRRKGEFSVQNREGKKEEEGKKGGRKREEERRRLAGPGRRPARTVPTSICGPKWRRVVVLEGVGDSGYGVESDCDGDYGW